MFEADQELLDAARHAASFAYAPYSHTRVGASVRAGAAIFTGANVENVSLGVSICAERVAIFKAVTAGARQIDAMAVACLGSSAFPNSSYLPCGACRQVMFEFAAASARVQVDGVGTFAIAELLPYSFPQP